jgi:RNA polymerase sigma-70 factor (ECF subfamily)
MGKIVTDKEFETAFNNPDHQAIMGSVCNKFRNSLDVDELYSIKLISLWNALKTWDSNGRKFSSYLYQAVRWGCIKSVQDKAKNPVYNIEFDRKMKKNDNFVELIELLPEELREIFVKRFVGGLTLRELAQTYGCCAESARRKILKGLSILRENHQF